MLERRCTNMEKRKQIQWMFFKEAILWFWNYLDFLFVKEMMILHVLLVNNQIKCLNFCIHKYSPNNKCYSEISKKIFLKKGIFFSWGLSKFIASFLITANMEACIDWIELRCRRTTLWVKIFFLNSREIACSEGVAWVLW